MNIIKISNAEKGGSPNISSKECRKVCRTCLKQDGLLNLFEKPNDLSLNDLFVIFSIFQADPEDGFPQTICQKCAKAIRTLYSFKKRVEENQMILKLASLKAQNLDTSLQSKDSLLVTIVEGPGIQNEYENDISSFDAYEHTGFDEDDFTENKENIEITNNPLPRVISNKFNIELPLDHDYVKTEQEYTFYNYDGKNEEPESTGDKEEINCSHCNLLFNTKQEYLIHMAAISKEKSDLPKTKPSKIKKVNLTCPGCKITFETRNQYTEHKNVCSTIDLTEEAKESQDANTEYTCPYCKTLFHSRGEYMKHRKEEARKKSVCPYCKKIVHTSKFDNHLRLIHKKLPPLKCDTCGKRFVSETIYNNHVQGHKDGFFCEICGRKVLTEYALKSHKKIHERTDLPDKQVFECNICKKVIKHLYLYREHMYTHTGIRPYLCSTCGSTFKSQARLHQHTLLKHTERPFVCSICGNNYPSESKLEKHFQRHDDKKNNECGVCSKQFMKKSSLIMHLKSHDTKREVDSQDDLIKTEVTPHYTKGNESQRKKIHCMSCGKEYFSTGLVNFQIHVRKHLGESPFLCLLCGKQFIEENEFTFHKELHGNQKLENIYFCQYCQKINASKAALRNHLRYHTGEKPFPCNICGKSFFLKAHLNTHLFWHTGQKPYGCNYCDKSFGMKGNLEQHERTHLGQRNYTCTICQKSFYTNSSLRKHQQVHFKNILGQDMPVI